MSTFNKIILLLVVFLHNEVFCSPLPEEGGWNNFVSSVSSRRINRDNGRHVEGEHPFVVDLTSVDPCQDVTCREEEVCIVHNTDSTRCIPNEEITDFVVDHCTPCHSHHHHGNPVCGDNGQTFKNICELEYAACITDNNIRSACDGECPCPETQDISEPQNMRITSLPNDVTSSKIMITWEPPLGYAEVGDVSEYIIHYMRVGGNGWSQVHTPGLLTSIDIAGLVPNSEYYFRTQAVVGETKGRPSDVKLFQTSPLRKEEYVEAILTDNEYGDITDDEDASGDGDREH